MTDDVTETFTAHRELLFAMIYNMLGTVADTEDVLQETWLAWSRRADRSGAPFAVLVLDFDPSAPAAESVTGVYAITNPDKLSNVT